MTIHYHHHINRLSRQIAAKQREVRRYVAIVGDYDFEALPWLEESP